MSTDAAMMMAMTIGMTATAMSLVRRPLNMDETMRRALAMMPSSPAVCSETSLRVLGRRRLPWLTAVLPVSTSMPKKLGVRSPLREVLGGACRELVHARRAAREDLPDVPRRLEAVRKRVVGVTRGIEASRIAPACGADRETTRSVAYRRRERFRCDSARRPSPRLRPEVAA